MDIQKPANYFDWWKSQSDSVVFGDMMSYCEHVRDRTANEVRYLKCCGANECTVPQCTKQTTWSFLGPRNIGSKNFSITLEYLVFENKIDFFDFCIVDFV